MRNIKLLCLLLGFIAFLVAASGQSVSPSGKATFHSVDGKVVPDAGNNYQLFIPVPWYGRIAAVLQVLGFLALYFGIENRAIEAWRLGFVLLAVGYVHFIVGIWISLADQSVFLFPFLMSLCLGGAVTLYWGIWWYQRKGYFTE